MGIFGTKEFWVELIGYASIVSVAIFGLIGALSKEWDRRNKKARTAEAEAGTATADGGGEDARAPRFSWSYIAAVGVILSAVFAMTSNILQNWIDTENQAAAAEKALAERREQDRRFKTQVDQLTGLNEGMRTANHASRVLMADMGRSLQSQDRMLTAQDVLLTSARQSMLMTAGLTSQERRNTDAVLGSVWEEANRIAPRGFQLVVEHNCRPVPGAEEAPSLLHNALARLAVDGLDSSGRSRDFTGLVPRHVAPRRQDGASIGHVTIFDGFLGPETTAFSDPALWREAEVGIRLDSPLKMSMAALEALVGDLPRGSAGAPASLRNCTAEFQLLINDRQVLYTPARMVVTEDAGGEVNIRVTSPPKRIDSSVLPVRPGRLAR